MNKRVARVAVAVAVALVAVNNEVIPTIELGQDTVLMADYTVWGGYDVHIGYQRTLWRPGCSYSGADNDDGDIKPFIDVMPVACRASRALSVALRPAGVAMGAAAAVKPQWVAVAAAVTTAGLMGALAAVHVAIATTLQEPTVVPGIVSLWVSAVAAAMCAAMMRPPFRDAESQPLITVVN